LSAARFTWLMQLKNAILDGVLMSLLLFVVVVVVVVVVEVGEQSRCIVVVLLELALIKSLTNAHTDNYHRTYLQRQNKRLSA
jgi:type IV secretory pathway VirB3-like protein